MFSMKPKLDRSDINEFYYILPVANLESVLKYGLLSHKRVSRLGGGSVASHIDISDHDVQDRRDGKEIHPKLRIRAHARELHQYVNLYIQPHNAMMFVKKGESDGLCVLRIRKEILDREDGIFTNRNAATDAAQFFKPAKWQLTVEGSEALRGQYLKGTDNSVYLDGAAFKQRKQMRQAEALFAYEVPAEFIGGIFVANELVAKQVAKLIKKSGRTDISITIHSSLFMQNGLEYHKQKLDSFSLLPELTGAQKTALLTVPDPESSASEAEDDETEQDATAFGFS